VYNFLAVPLLWIIFHLLGVFNKKIRKGIQGRKNLFERLDFALYPDRSYGNLSMASGGKSGGKRIWFHSSSMGEFEQAKPIIEMLKQKFPEMDIIVSFFSPSGYENTRNYHFADYITYMPFDTFFQAKKFVEIVQPTAAVIMRYDIWPNHIWQLAKYHIPTFLVDATVGKRSSKRFPLVKSFHKACYNAVNYILTVSANDVEGFRRYHAEHPVIEVAGDTRYDRVYMKSKEAIKKKVIPEYILQGKKVFIVGSSWDSDEEHIFPVFCKLQHSEPDLLMILVPHEPSEQNLDRIETELAKRTTTIRFSSLQDYNGERVIIIDCVGILLSVYACGHIAYVGGSFKPGVHNVLEAATYGIPVLFGPKIDNSQEAQELVRRGGGFVVGNKKNLYRRLRELLSDETKRRKAGEEALKLVRENIGATEKIISYIEKAL